MTLLDGTDRLCWALYGHAPKAQDYLGGSEAKMLHDAADEILHLRQSQEKIWGIADEAQYAHFERSIEQAIRQACTCGGGGPHDDHTCPACMVWHWYKHPALAKTRRP
jgi:hypothetical protein